MVNKWLDSLLSIVYPRNCVLCGAPGQRDLDLCPGCCADLPAITRPCPRCGLPLPAMTASGLPCGACQRQAPAYDQCWAPLAYAEAVPYLVTGLKFRSRLPFARLLGSLLATSLQNNHAPVPQLLLPVPLHPSRLRERGYNQALEVAREVARRMDIPLAVDACIRIRHTVPQVGLDRASRRRNLRGAFALVRSLPVQHVALIDDVVSTGSTVEELARILKAAGIERVDVWAAARATFGRF